MTLRCRPPTFVGIILGYRCTCACRHCLYACSPGRSGELDGDGVRRIVQTLASLPVRPSLHLAGGEAFLWPDLLVEATRHVSEAGLEMDFIETNAAWVRDESQALELLQRLAEAGAPRLLISCTPLHAESIPMRKVTALVHLATEVFGPHGAALWTPDFYAQLTAIDDHGRIPFGTYLDRVGRANAQMSLLYRFPMTVAGRAALGLGDLVRRVPASDIPARPCEAALLGTGHAHFDPDGSHVPGYCAGIALGRYGDLPNLLGEGLDEQAFPLVSLLSRSGAAGLLAWAEQEHGFVPDPSGYRGECHLCQEIRAHLLDQGEGAGELEPREFYEELRRPLTPSSSTSPPG